MLFRLFAQWRHVASNDLDRLHSTGPAQSTKRRCLCKHESESPFASFCWVCGSTWLVKSEGKSFNPYIYISNLFCFSIVVSFSAFVICHFWSSTFFSSVFSLAVDPALIVQCREVMSHALEFTQWLTSKTDNFGQGLLHYGGDMIFLMRNVVLRCADPEIQVLTSFLFFLSLSFLFFSS
jgi:hypothetical protein